MVIMKSDNNDHYDAQHLFVFFSLLINLIFTKLKYNSSYLDTRTMS